ncbi:MAG: hypothetical protein Kow0077_12800 [Anaerolineae bacterium]
MIAAVAVLGLAAVLWMGSHVAVTAGPSPEVLAQMTPQQVTRAFYTWYRDMLAADVLCHPLLDGAYQDSPYLSARLISALDDVVARSCGTGLAADPLLCTADLPADVGTRIIQTQTDSASVLVYGRYPTESPVSETRVLAVASLVREDGRWLIDAVECR